MLKFLKLQTGEIATFLTLLSLGLMVAGAAAGSYLAQQRQTTRTLAAYPSWDWDGAASQCPAGDGSCICTKIGQANNINSGICTPVCGSDALGRKCISNKWDETWGCWGPNTFDCKQ